MWTTYKGIEFLSFSPFVLCPIILVRTFEFYESDDILLDFKLSHLDDLTVREMKVSGFGSRVRI